METGAIMEIERNKSGLAHQSGYDFSELEDQAKSEDAAAKRSRWKEALKNLQDKGSVKLLLEAVAEMGKPDPSHAINKPLDEPRAELFRALAALGRVEELERLSNLGYSMRCAEGTDSLLVFAIRNKQGVCVKWLLEKDESLANAASGKGMSPLEEAASAKSTEALLAVIERADPLRMAPNGSGALKALAKSENPMAIKAFFARMTREQTRGALTQKDHQGVSGLARLAETLDCETLKAVFLRAKACKGLVDQRGHNGESVLHTVCRRASQGAHKVFNTQSDSAFDAQSASGLVDILLSESFDPNAMTKEGFSALLEATSSFFNESKFPDGILKIVKMLLEAGADPDLPGPRGVTFKALVKAYGRQSADELRALMEARELQSSLTSLVDMPFAEEPGAKPKELASIPAPRL